MALIISIFHSWTVNTSFYNIGNGYKGVPIFFNTGRLIITPPKMLLNPLISIKWLSIIVTTIWTELSDIFTPALFLNLLYILSKNDIFINGVVESTPNLHSSFIKSSVYHSLHMGIQLLLILKVILYFLISCIKYVLSIFINCCKYLYIILNKQGIGSYYSTLGT